jgi:CRP/FNR family cyclic AMP-dependent transcriptional regulator
MGTSQHQNNSWLLSRVPLFASLEPSAVDALALEVRPLSPRAGEVVLEQGTAARGVYVVLSGKLKVSVVSPRGVDIALSVMGPGEVFGEMAVMDGELHSATVTAITPCDLRVIERDRFLRFLDEHPRAMLPLLKLFAQRLRSLTLRSEALGSMLPARLAKILMLLVARFGVRDEGAVDTVRLDVELSQKTIGEFAGVSRESVNKQMRAWEAMGIVAKVDGEIVIKRLATLREICDQEQEQEHGGGGGGGGGGDRSSGI